MPMWIAGIGVAVPSHSIAQADAAAIAQQFACETDGQQRALLSLYRKAGVEKRHCVMLDTSTGELGDRQSFYGVNNPTTRDRMHRYEENASALALSAAQNALANAAIVPGRITHLVTVSCSGFYAPGIDITLIKQLGLSSEVARTHVGFMGCHGALNGLRVANAYLTADRSACVLLCAVELCSLHHQYGWHTERIVANSLFADGAGAVVGVAGESMQSRTCRVVATGSTVIDDSEDAMSWRIGDHGFQMTLSARVPELIGRHLRPWLETWLSRHGLTVGTIGSWAVHPGGPRILSAFGEATGIDRDAIAHSLAVLADYGNMSSPTILFILDRLRAAAAPRPWVALAFGPGLAVEAALLA